MFMIKVLEGLAMSLRQHPLQLRAVITPDLTLCQSSDLDPSLVFISKN